MPRWCQWAALAQKGRWTPSSYQELLFQLLGAGWLVLQDPACEGVSRCAQEVQGDLPGCAHGADGLHGPQGPHVQHQSHAGAPPADRQPALGERRDSAPLTAVTVTGQVGGGLSRAPDQGPVSPRAQATSPPFPLLSQNRWPWTQLLSPAAHLS